MPYISDVRYPMMRYDTGTLSLVLWDGSLTAGSVTIGAVTFAGSSTATLSNVNDSNTNQTLLASNSGRKGVTCQNDSTSSLFLKYGATATSTSYTVKVPPGSYWEMPQPPYTGQIDGIWSADASGAARLTEW